MTVATDKPLWHRRPPPHEPEFFRRTGMQDALKRDWVLKLKVYPRACKIN